jgi:hypothetical protein
VPGEQRDAAVMTEPSIATDSCHHPTVKAKAYSLVQLFFLLICIISTLLSLVIRSSSVPLPRRAQLVSSLAHCSDEHLGAPPESHLRQATCGSRFGPGVSPSPLWHVHFRHVPVWAAGCLPAFPAALAAFAARARQSALVRVIANPALQLRRSAGCRAPLRPVAAWSLQPPRIALVGADRLLQPFRVLGAILPRGRLIAP